MVANNKVKIEITCIQCDRDYVIFVYPEDIVKREEGAYIQDAFPYLSAGERELMISKICGSCFDEMFPSDYEDEDEED